MVLKETKETRTDGEPNYTVRFAQAVAAILLTMVLMAMDRFG